MEDDTEVVSLDVTYRVLHVGERSDRGVRLVLSMLSRVVVSQAGFYPLHYTSHTVQ